MPGDGDASDWLVVYGSLMRGLPSPTGAGASPTRAAGDLLDRLDVGRGLRCVGPCRVPGILFDLGPYPGLRAARGAADVVCGELHAVLDSRVLTVLDGFEGFDPRDPVGSDYLRERIELLEPRGVCAWIYVYNREPEPNRRIETGDWRSHLAERSRSAHDPASWRA